MKRLFIILTGVLLPVIAAGQQYTSSQEKPDWVNGYFDDLNNSYIKIADAWGYSENEAQNKAVTSAIFGQSIVTGIRVTVKLDGEITVEGSDNLTVKARVIDKYVEYSGGQYHVYLLVQTAKNPAPNYEYDCVKVNSDYPFSPRVFVSGMAQLYKGSKTKGLLFITGEIVFAGSIVIAENLRASYKSKIKSTHDAAAMQNYIGKADTWSNVRNAAIAGAAVLYAWNVIDGATAKGRKRIWICGNHLQITPYASPYAAGAGLTLALNF